MRSGFAVLWIGCAALVGVVTASSCNTAAVCSPECGAGFTCHSGRCDPDPCDPGCDSSSVCVLGQCVLDAGVRIPRVSSCNFTIVNGGKLGPTTAPACTKPISTPQVPTSEVQAFGTQPVGSVVSFNVPAGTESFTIMQQSVRSISTINYFGFTIGNSAVPDLVTSPTQGVLFNDNPVADAGETPDGESSLLFFIPGDRDVATLTVPNTTPMLLVAGDGGVTSGTWSFTVSDYANECLTTAGCDGGTDAGAYDVTVVTKPIGSAGVRTVDFTFIMVAPVAQRATAASTDAHFFRMVDALASMYQAAGICPGTVTVYDAPDWAQTAYATGVSIDDQTECGPLPQLFAIAPSGNSLNFFLLPDLLGKQPNGSQFQVVGLDGTIPGPSGFPNTVNSGAAVNGADVFHGSCTSETLDVTTCGPDRTAYIAAHEGGHWLGLYHTTEGLGVDFDPLTDTPRCPCGACTSGTPHQKCLDVSPNTNPNNATQVTADDCDTPATGCGGAENLMFWLAGTTGSLTPQQADVMRRNLAVH